MALNLQKTQRSAAQRKLYLDAVTLLKRNTILPYVYYFESHLGWDSMESEAQGSAPFSTSLSVFSVSFFVAAFVVVAVGVVTGEVVRQADRRARRHELRRPLVIYHLHQPPCETKGPTSPHFTSTEQLHARHKGLSARLTAFETVIFFCRCCSS
ncbi:hypothetical protein IWX49DRAFT_232239 [Phyllosticta citricarpa]